jgi:hypothetical protein
MSKSRTATAPRTELERSLKRVDASDALASIAEASQKPRVLVWQSSPGKWSRYAVKENDLKLGFAESFDSAMKRAKNKFPLARIDHDAKMTDKQAKALKKKFEATIDAARAEAGKPALARDAAPIKGKNGKSPGKAPADNDPSKEQQIADLLDELRGTTDPDEKKRIRRKLRARGHRGGLNGAPGKKAKTKAPKPADPDDEDDDLDTDDDD